DAGVVGHFGVQRAVVARRTVEVLHASGDGGDVALLRVGTVGGLDLREDDEGSNREDGDDAEDEQDLDERETALVALNRLHEKLHWFEGEPGSLGRQLRHGLELDLNRKHLLNLKGKFQLSIVLRRDFFTMSRRPLWT